MNEQSDELVFWLDPWAWDKDFDIVPLDRSPEPVEQWLELVHAQGWKVMLLPYDARISGGPCSGGHVLAVETGEGRQYAAVPPSAIPVLQGDLPHADFEALMKVTPVPENGTAPEGEQHRP